MDPGQKRLHDEVFLPRTGGTRPSENASDTKNNGSGSRRQRPYRSRSGEMYTTPGADFTVKEILYLSLEEAVKGCIKTHVFTGPPSASRKYRAEIRIQEFFVFGKNKVVQSEGYPSKNGGVNGDLIIPVRVKSPYLISGLNLHLEFRVTVVEALLGKRFSLPDCLGEKIFLDLPPRAKNSVITILHKGLTQPPGAGAPTWRGHIKVKIVVEEPRNLSVKQQEEVQTLAAQLESLLYAKPVR